MVPSPAQAVLSAHVWSILDRSRPGQPRFFRAAGAAAYGGSSRPHSRPYQAHRTSHSPSGPRIIPQEAQRTRGPTVRLSEVLPAELSSLLPDRLLSQESLLPQLGVDLWLSTKDWQRPLGGRLRHFGQAWARVTGDPWVLRAVAGVELELTGVPIPAERPGRRPMSVDQVTVLTAEVTALLEKDVIFEVPRGQESFLSPLFAVPKSDGKIRPVVDLRQLNTFCRVPPFQDGGDSSSSRHPRAGRLFGQGRPEGRVSVSPDSPDAPASLGLQVGGQSLSSSGALPFGLASAPFTFTKILHPVMVVLRQLGIRLIVYLDDILVLGRTAEETSQAVTTLLHLLYTLGFVVNLAKSVLTPSQVLEVSGVRSVHRLDQPAVVGEENPEDFESLPGGPWQDPDFPTENSPAVSA